MRFTRRQLRGIRLGRKAIDGRFVIPSGIRCTRASTVDWVFRHIPSVGIITTKSISAFPKEGYREPVYAEYAPRCYINAVGLANMGAISFRHELAGIEIPQNKFLLISIFGTDASEFVEAARVLEDSADGFELNMSCPHAKGYGIEIGHDPGLVAEITHAVASETTRPVIVKLPATCRDIGVTAQVAMDAGAVGISTINTVGPSTHFVGGQPVLHNQVGGLSGEGVRPLGLSSVRRVRSVLGREPLVIGMGGITTCADIRDFAAAGADFFGIGSALTGMDSETGARFLAALESGLVSSQEDEAAEIIHATQRRMEYIQCSLAKREQIGHMLYRLWIDAPDELFATPSPSGRFYFLYVPGVGEKPFALFSEEDRSFVVKVKGPFTDYLSQHPEGEPIYVRGPYGGELPALIGRDIVLVGGGTGVAPLLSIARRYHGANKLKFLIGAKSKDELFGTEEVRVWGDVEVATDDGSEGHHGYVSDLLSDVLSRDSGFEGAVFMNSGPERMVFKCFLLESRVTNREDIWGAISYHTSCGVGICGKCATPSGLLSCVDGPFLRMAEFGV